MTNPLIERTVDSLKKQLRFNVSNYESTGLSDNLVDFVGHLMSPAHEPIGHKTENPNLIYEVTVYQAPKIDMLKHQAVNQNRPVEDAEHVERYKTLMNRGQEIGARVPNVYGNMLKGFKSYSSSVGENEDPRVTQSKALAQARDTFKNHLRQVGYKADSAPNLITGNTKTAKNEAKGDIAAGLTLAPARAHNLGKHTSCKDATTECENSCLAYTTGQNAMLSAINSKIAKHHFVAEHPEHAARIIHAELLNHIDNVAKWNAEKGPGEKKLIASYRPNMVTDYDHSKLSGDMIDHVTRYAKNRGVEFQVRDYTKSAERLTRPKPANYFMALSHTGSSHPESNDEAVGKALNLGHTVASVVHGDATHFYDHKTKRLYPMVDGDDDDQIEKRHEQVGHITMPDGTGLDKKTGRPTGVVSVLRVKGGSHKIKEAAGAFENQTTTFHHPEHGPMRVVEINK